MGQVGRQSPKPLSLIHIFGGISSSREMCIDGTKEVMNLHVQEKQKNDVNIGNEWRLKFQLNGESVTNNPTLTVGDSLSLYAQMIEEDDKPDVGEASLNHVVTEAVSYTHLDVYKRQAVDCASHKGKSGKGGRSRIRQNRNHLCSFFSLSLIHI